MTGSGNDSDEKVIKDLARFLSLNGDAPGTIGGAAHNHKRSPEFVVLHPLDDGRDLLDVFLSHPDTYTPHRSPLNGRSEHWGFFPYFPKGHEYEGMLDIPMYAMMGRNMQTSRHYLGNIQKPEEQFVHALMEKKMKALDATNLGDLTRQDLILKIQYLGFTDKAGEPRVWRRFRVSAGLSLSAFADKIVTPVMGWTRNYHAHVFTDYRDGATFGPEGCNAIDMMHIAGIGYGFIPERRYKVAHILRQAGDAMGWLYDFGDNWRHEILLETVIPVEESTGKFELIAASGACPREDGSNNWEKDVGMLTSGSNRERNEALDEIKKAMNYRDKPWNGMFDPDYANLDDLRRGVAEALSLPAAVRQASKTHVMPLHPGGFNLRTPALKKGQHMVHSPENIGWTEEAVTNKRDGMSVAACSNCSSPLKLKLCAKCRAVYYCGGECQTAHWKSRHKRECKLLANKKEPVLPSSS